jgi:hypothetical protein
MLDKKMEMMLSVANLLTAEDLEMLRAGAAGTVVAVACDDTEDPSGPEQETTQIADGPDEADGHDSGTASVADSGSLPPTTRGAARRRSRSPQASMTQGEYERQRTRESKISTACVGHEREKHDWWLVGTELIGRIGSDTFTATVVENAQVKSGRSLLITSGPANGKVCLTPTRAAIEATESYRQANNLGRGGGVTNGWDFWRPASS